MTKIKKGDFVEFDFIGRIKSTNTVFDLTLKDIAEKEGLDSKREFKPLIARIGEGHLIEGLDTALTGRELNKEFEIDVPAEKAFGKKNPKLIQLTSLNMFTTKKIKPYPGLQLNVDGSMAMVRSVSGGRVVLDFNHPLSGRELHYWVKPLKIITDDFEKAQSIVSLWGVKADVKKGKDNEIQIKLELDLPEQAKKHLLERIQKQVPAAKFKFL